MNPMPATGSTFRSHSNRPLPPGGSGFSKARTDLPGGCGGSVTVVPSGRVIVTGLAAVVPEGGSSRLLRAVRRSIGLPMAPPRVGLYRLAHKRSDAGLGRPGESHPRAPLERSVTVSCHSARAVLIIKGCLTHAQWAK